MDHAKVISTFLLILGKLFTIVRFKIDEPYNCILLEITNKYMVLYVNEKVLDIESYKNEVLDYLKQDEYFNSQDEYSQTLVFNIFSFEIKEYTNNIKEITKYFLVFHESISEICHLLSSVDFNRAYDLVDAIHGLPEALFFKTKWNPKRYWKVYIGSYRKKWDKNFLIIKEKELVKPNFLRNLFVT